METSPTSTSCTEKHVCTFPIALTFCEICHGIQMHRLVYLKEMTCECGKVLLTPYCHCNAYRQNPMVWDA